MHGLPSTFVVIFRMSLSSFYLISRRPLCLLSADEKKSKKLTTQRAEGERWERNHEFNFRDTFSRASSHVFNWTAEKIHFVCCVACTLRKGAINAASFPFFQLKKHRHVPKGTQGRRFRDDSEIFLKVFFRFSHLSALWCVKCRGKYSRNRLLLSKGRLQEGSCDRASCEELRW